MSAATARKPASASAGSWRRHEYQNSGKPCRRTTSGPVPASTTCRRTSPTSTWRWACCPALISPVIPNRGSVESLHVAHHGARSARPERVQPAGRPHPRRLLLGRLLHLLEGGARGRAPPPTGDHA